MKNILSILLNANPVANQLVNNDIINIVHNLVIGGLAIGAIGVIKSFATKNENATKKGIAWIIALIVYQIAKHIYL